MQTGTVKRFDVMRGYGFIKPDSGGREIYVHRSEINAFGIKILNEGERVTFEIGRGRRGLRAKNVQPRDVQPDRSRSKDRHDQ